MANLVNSPEDAVALAKAFILSAEIIRQHDKFTRDHNYEMAYAMIDAAARVTGEELGKKERNQAKIQRARRMLDRR